MDPSTFDELTKALAIAASRRQALKAIGAALGGALGLSRIGIAFAKCKDVGHPCSKNKHCCSKLCCHGKCCDSGQICSNGACVTPTMCSSGTDLCLTVGPFCGPGGQCICATDVDGSVVCSTVIAPTSSCFSCMSDTDCGSNSVCVRAACCPNGTACLPRC